MACQAFLGQQAAISPPHSEALEAIEAWHELYIPAEWLMDRWKPFLVLELDKVHILR